MAWKAVAHKLAALRKEPRTLALWALTASIAFPATGFATVAPAVCPHMDQAPQMPNMWPTACATRRRSHQLPCPQSSAPDAHPSPAVRTVAPDPAPRPRLRLPHDLPHNRTVRIPVRRTHGATPGLLAHLRGALGGQPPRL